MEFSLIVLLAFLSFMISWTGNVFMSLMYAVMLFVNATLVLLTLGFEFLALVNMLVYVGALAVLFLFVIMLLEIPSAELRAYYRGYSALTFVGLIAVLIKQFGNNTSPYLSLIGDDRQSSLGCYQFSSTSESISNIGVAFYIRYADVLILNSLVLTIALFGALVLAHSRQ